MSTTQTTATPTTLRDGDKFTIAGMRQRRDGTFTFRCKPGNETLFTAVEVKSTRNQA